MCVLIELTLYLREAFDHLVHRLVTSKSIAGLRERERRPICAYFVCLPPPSFVTIFGGVSSFHPSHSEVGWRGMCVIFKLQRLWLTAQGRLQPSKHHIKMLSKFQTLENFTPCNQRSVTSTQSSSPDFYLSLLFFLLLPFVSLFSQSPSLVVPLPVLKTGLHQTVKNFYSTLCLNIQHYVQFYFEE